MQAIGRSTPLQLLLYATGQFQLPVCAGGGRCKPDVVLTLHQESTWGLVQFVSMIFAFHIWKRAWINAQTFSRFVQIECSLRGKTDAVLHIYIAWVHGTPIRNLASIFHRVLSHHSHAQLHCLISNRLHRTDDKLKICLINQIRPV